MGAGGVSTRPATQDGGWGVLPQESGGYLWSQPGACPPTGGKIGYVYTRNTLGCMGSLQVAIAGQRAGTGATCVPELCRGQKPVSAEIAGWGSLSPTASLAARGVWCLAQGASFACRVLRTSSSELLFSSCSRPSSLSCETRGDPFSSGLRPCASPPPALAQPSLLPCQVGQ